MTPKKLTSEEILHNIFNAIKSSEKPLTIKDISDRTGIYHSTIKKHLIMIEFIQNEDKLIIKPTGSSYQISLENKE